MESCMFTTMLLWLGLGKKEKDFQFVGHLKTDLSQYVREGSSRCADEGPGIGKQGLPGLKAPSLSDKLQQKQPEIVGSYLFSSPNIANFFLSVKELSVLEFPLLCFCFLNIQVIWKQGTHVFFLFLQQYELSITHSFVDSNLLHD